MLIKRTNAIIIEVIAADLYYICPPYDSPHVELARIP